MNDGETTEDLGVAAGLVRLTFLVQSVYSEVCDTHALTPPQAQLLCVLSESASGMAELGRILHLEKSSLTGLVDRAERKGLVRRAASTSDGRAVTVQLTKRGTTLAAAFHQDATDRLNAMVAGLPAATQRRFAAIAGRIVNDHAVPVVFHDSCAGVDSADS
jgi:DNA-binding MarR family transcriptional regulator